MQLKRFKVTNFRSVVDSGWIEAERVTAFIGINESGKTNLMLPLWKLNPARDGEIVPTSDYPKTNYAAVRADPSAFTFIQAEFIVGDLAERIAALTGHELQHLELVQVSRAFEGDIEMFFPGCVPAEAVDATEIQSALTDGARELEAIPALAKEATLKIDILQCLQAVAAQAKGHNSLSADELAACRKQISEVLPDQAAATSSLVPRLKRLIGAFKTWKTSCELNLLKIMRKSET